VWELRYRELTTITLNREPYPKGETLLELEKTVSVTGLAGIMPRKRGLTEHTMAPWVGACTMSQNHPLTIALITIS
jgi:hypothetical protein